MTRRLIRILAVVLLEQQRLLWPLIGSTTESEDRLLSRDL